MSEEKTKNPIAEREKKILKFWQENKIFEKSVAKAGPKGDFVFYEGPPTANGKPGIHHLEARAFKDAIPRYKTMQGFRVRRKGGWDTHGLAVEIQTEKELGLKSKKEIEAYGVDAFNKKCRESVWRYVKEWEEFTERTGYWIDLKRPYVTYKPYYIESVWNIISKINEQGLLYKDYKVVPWCPRCGTGLSSHELAQGYEDVKDLSVTVKFKLTNNNQQLATEGGETYLLAWTTTPWTLPGNVGLAVGNKVKYVKVKVGEEFYILAKERLTSVMKDKEHGVIEELLGEKLVGLEYEPLYPFLKDNLSETEKLKLKNAFKVYVADFVTTTDGTGIVHTAVMYGTDDFDLGTKVGLPKHHLVNDDGTFKKETAFLAGKFVKDEATDVEIIKDLAHRGLLFSKEKYSHSYPHCWRCHTPLIYFARDSWYIKMSALRDKLVAGNQSINWEPSYIKEGRFGEWLKDIKDWAISRERYWGTPLPVWECTSCDKRKMIGSFDELFLNGQGKKLTRLVLVRHGESEKNILELYDISRDGYPLTTAGRKSAEEAGEKLKKLGKIDAIYTSPVIRACQTSEIIGKVFGVEPVLSDELWEVKSGEWEGLNDSSIDKREDKKFYDKLSHEDYYQTSRGKTGESWQDVENRMTSFVKGILKKHQGETVVVVSHEGPLMVLLRYLKELSLDEIINLWEERRAFHRGLLGEYAEPTNVYISNQTGNEIDPHRPFIDDFVLKCDCGKEMKRVKEVMDVWLDSGAMPFAQEHYPFKNKEEIDSGKGYPADYISEAIDQTRGWFYTLHAVGTLLGKGNAYKNVICLGHILDGEGKKMSKSLGNVVDPNLMMEKYGADALRFWMYSINQPGEPKNFDEKTVDEIVKKVFNLAGNVLAFYHLYASSLNPKPSILNPVHVLDVWIVARLNQLVGEVTTSLNAYQLLEPTRAIRDFIADLSQWYLRRSRERIKNGGEDAQAALSTLKFVLCELSKLMAPFTPFFAEFLYKEVGGENESVHLESWPTIDSKFKIEDSRKILEEMEEIRRIVSLALEQRAKANIKVRQPLSSLKLKSKILNLESGVSNLIQEEVNVKKVVFDANILSDVELDTTITLELKEEGNVREFVRAIQDLRKTTGLSASDVASLTVDTDEKGVRFVKKFESELMKMTQLREIKFVSIDEGFMILIDDFSMKISVQK
ncbi:MAG: isoleucine--tRNA ligase [Candidatus Taylorbacteria bacterium]|nr:isoleucine--tRNA ligase [Candidatus Taylorbacteria bacterium]